jgi:NADP-dependent 3-hydroxy acid dehydrogenase YdfG
MDGTKWLKPSVSVSRIGDSASVQAVTRVNAEQLAETISNPDLKKRIEDYRKMAIPAEAIASAMAYAIGQPSNVAVDEILIRPTA